ncbi:MAG: hypothetical protein ALECFALPRED_008655 [Alectoria fallacina]|uniref:Uncharacterized protein n=1 Tax=Alectoria fallacina TaxID=1903189 RepID=A0A8H3ETH2_9LECA|nr:MAG: hypothetical protein ALECFALPRED_008655 [Alectoria fallacina]
MPSFSDKLHLMANLSMDFEVIDSGITDAVLSKRPTEYALHCPQLRTLTIQLLIGRWLIQDFPADSATARVLRQLRPRLDNLSVLVLHSRPHEVLPELRLSNADHKYWSGTSWSDQCWSGQCQSGFNTRPLQWPYLTLPSLIQGHAGMECTKSKDFGLFSG